MIEQLLGDDAAEMYRRSLPSPVHMPNLITFDDEAPYQRYTRLAIPLVLLVGGRPVWHGDHAATYEGRDWDRFFIVTYPSHRRLVLMTSNPYYEFINRYRERGVSYFEIGFTHPVETTGDLDATECLLVAQLPDDDVGANLATARAAFEDTPADLVYATREVSPLDHHGEPELDSDPHPFTHKLLACFGVSSREDADEAAETATTALSTAFDDYGLAAFE